MLLGRGNVVLVYTLRGTPFEVVSEYCDFGVTTDNVLTFSQHVEKIE